MKENEAKVIVTGENTIEVKEKKTFGQCLKGFMTNPVTKAVAGGAGAVLLGGAAGAYCGSKAGAKAGRNAAGQYMTPDESTTERRSGRRAE